MRTASRRGVIRLNESETKLWRKASMPSARGRDHGRRATMCRDLTVLARVQAATRGHETVDVVGSDGAVLLTVEIQERPVEYVRSVRRGMVG